MLKIAVCDSNRKDIEYIEAVLDKPCRCPVEYDVYFCAEELLEHRRIYRETYHLYIICIELPGLNGLDLAKEIRKDDEKALFVFLAIHSEYVMEVFDVITFDYILKPITEEKLESTLSKAMRHLDMTKRDFVFKYRKDHFRISCDDIFYFEKNGRQVMIHTMHEIYKANMTIKELWEQLDQRVFAHIHMSYIVNLGRIMSIEGNEAILDNKKHLLIARSHKQELKEKYAEYIARRG